VSASDRRPNILVFIPHDLGTFLGCCGHDTVRSPHIDRLAARGVSFRNCFTTSPECTPSRGGLLTGLYPHQNGLMGLSNFGWSLRVPHLAARLRACGYATHQFGFQHETHTSVEVLGYDRGHRGGSTEADVVCADLRSFIRSAAPRDGAPWFACAGFRHVHRAWPRATRFCPDDVAVPPWLPDHPEVRKDLARFHQDIEDMDAAVGSVLTVLEETGIGKDTLVLFTTDHGAAFPGAKATLYDPGIRVPVICHWPGHVEGGAWHDALVSNLDVTPTVLEIAGGEVPEGLAGRSVLPLLQGGGTFAERDCVCGALFYDVAYDPVHYVRTRAHKYVRSFAATDADARGADPETLTTFAAGRWIRCDDFDVLTTPTWQALAPPGGEPRPPAEELYDLRADPEERHNLVDQPGAQHVLADMRARLRAMMQETDSPLLRGHVQPPERQREAARTHGPNTPLFARTVAERKALQG
jgi:arylsulfatase A-like enzyme